GGLFGSNSSLSRSCYPGRHLILAILGHGMHEDPAMSQIVVHADRRCPRTGSGQTFGHSGVIGRSSPANFTAPREGTAPPFGGTEPVAPVCSRASATAASRGGGC